MSDGCNTLAAHRADVGDPSSPPKPEPVTSWFVNQQGLQLDGILDIVQGDEVQVAALAGHSPRLAVCRKYGFILTGSGLASRCNTND